MVGGTCILSPIERNKDPQAPALKESKIVARVRDELLAIMKKGNLIDLQ